MIRCDPVTHILPLADKKNFPFFDENKISNGFLARSPLQHSRGISARSPLAVPPFRAAAFLAEVRADRHSGKADPEPRSATLLKQGLVPALRCLYHVKTFPVSLSSLVSWTPRERVLTVSRDAERGPLNRKVTRLSGSLSWTFSPLLSFPRCCLCCGRSFTAPGPEGRRGVSSRLVPVRFTRMGTVGHSLCGVRVFVMLRLEAQNENV